MLAAAVDVAAERGLRDLSVGDVARKAGVSPACVFQHFGTQARLQEEVLSEVFDLGGFDPLAASVAARGFPQCVWVLTRYLDLMSGHDPRASIRVRAIFEAGSLDDRPREVLVNRHLVERNVLTGFIKGAQKLGHIRSEIDAEALAIALHAVLIDCHLDVHVLQGDRPLETHAAAIRMLLDHVAVPGTYWPGPQPEDGTARPPAPER